MLAGIISLAFPPPPPSPLEIERQARGMGMVYREEVVLYTQVEKKEQEITVEAENGRCWLEVSTNGKLVFQGTLNKGEKKGFPGSTFKLKLGNPEAVCISYGNLSFYPVKTKRSTYFFQPGLIKEE